jgi:NAD(P)-dependent dehydrogenase (short-subunit alcohol dehydrogenase family)
MRRALVTGGNRGIGLAVVQALAESGVEVLLGSRGLVRGEEAASPLAARGLPVRPVALDVSARASIDKLCDELAAGATDVDILINNAGVYPSGGIFDADEAAFHEAMDVHFFGPLHLCRRLVPSMGARGWGRVVNVSSGYGSIGEGLDGPAAYSLSKAALGALTIKLATAAPAGVKINAACPGWVKTRMGGRGAPRTVEQGADTIVWLATLSDSGPHGGFFRNRKPIPW